MRPKILVIGDLMVDSYIIGSCNKISPEAPVGVVEVQQEYDLLGGAGNVVNNLLALGAQVSVASVVGDDEEGRWIENRLKSKGVKLFLAKEDRPTTKKSRIIAANQQIVRVDREEKKDISDSSCNYILDVVKNEEYDLILLSDYAKGVLSEKLTKDIIKYAKSKVFIDPKGEDYSKYRGANLITPNKKEASIASKIEIKDDDSLKKAGFFLKDRFDFENVIITLSEEGMAIFGSEFKKIPTFAKEVYDVTGAGDTVLAALGYFSSIGKSLEEAAYYANLAASVVVGKLGAATATIAEIEEYERILHRACSDEFIKSEEEIEEIVKVLKDKGKKIVFTNGCFDILHIGHIKYLQKAKRLGDILIVGVNSNSSVKRLKGSSRPINDEYDRAYLLAALEAVDYVVIFNEDTPYNLIKRIKPDVLVKGGDYKNKEIVGSDIAKETKLIEFVEQKSTTNIIERIKNA